MAKQKDNLIMFRATDSVLERLGNHNRNLDAKQALERYYYLLDASLETLRLRFTLNEIRLIADVLNGIVIDTYTIPILWARIRRARLEGFGVKWGVNDVQSLSERLYTLSLTQAAALIDAIERWWALPDADRDGSAESFEAVGLIVKGDSL